MDRLPKAPPFPVGTRLRYMGDMIMSTDAGERFLYPGVEASVCDVHAGWQGSLRWLHDDGDDEPIQDTTRDGYSVVELAGGHRRIAHADAWEVVSND